jgi:pimeloyl-ACP methyl ester carboxylesterase
VSDQVRFARRPDGAEICWAERGSGTPVLLIMGFAYPKEMWHRAIAALAPAHRVLYFDNRGVGGSRAPRGRYTMEMLAADAVAVLDAAGEDLAHVYGASLGGAIAKAVALDHPERVRSLLLGCTAARSANPAIRIGLRARLGLKVMTYIPRRWARRNMATRSYGPGADPARIAEDRAILEGSRVTRRGIEGQAWAVAGFTVLDRLGEIDVPTLVLHGTEDKTVPFAAGEQLADRIRGARFVRLEGAGHNYLTDSEAESNTAVLEFLASVDAAVQQEVSPS